MTQKRALLAKLGLPTDHYLTLARPLPSSLLAAAAVCLMPEAQAYQLLHASETGTVEAGDAARSDATAAPGLKDWHALNGQVPGMVEVGAAPASPQQGALDALGICFRYYVAMLGA